MPIASDIKDDSRFVGLLIGRSGSGKTAASLSFPKPLMCYDLDGRIRGGLTKWIDRKDIHFESFPIKVSNNQSVFERLNTHFEALLMNCQRGQNPYKTVVLDSITFEAIAFLMDAIPLTHGDRSGDGENKGPKGKRLGKLNMAGPEDYGFQSTATHQVLAFLRSLPIPNILVTAHVVAKWGKPPGADSYAENVIIGEQLLLTDKLAESVPTIFDHIIKFEKIDTGARLSFTASFQGELARTYLPVPYGKMDLTETDFYQKLKKYMTTSEPTSTAA